MSAMSETFDRSYAAEERRANEFVAAAWRHRAALLAIVNTRDGATLDGPDNVWQGMARDALEGREQAG